MHPSLLGKKLIPAFVHRHWQIWLCSLCFVIPFVVGGAGGWFWVAASYDHFGQSTTDKEYEDALTSMHQESSAAFVRNGLLYGFVGLSVGGGMVLLLRLRRHSKIKDESH